MGLRVGPQIPLASVDQGTVVILGEKSKPGSRVSDQMGQKKNNSVDIT